MRDAEDRRPVRSGGKSGRKQDKTHQIAHGVQKYHYLFLKSNAAILKGYMEPDWEQHGIRIVRAGELDLNTPQTPGMTRAAAITTAATGAQKLWGGAVVVQPHARTGAHHPGEVEALLYIVQGRARFHGGARLAFVP